MAVGIEGKVNSELAALMKVWAQEQGWNVDGWNWERDWRQDWAKAHEIFNLIDGETAKCEIFSIDCRDAYVEGVEIPLMDYFKLSEEDRERYYKELDDSKLKRDAIILRNKSYSLDTVQPVPYVLCKYTDDIPDRISHAADFLYAMLYIFSKDEDESDVERLREATNLFDDNIHLVNDAFELESHLWELKEGMNISELERHLSELERHLWERKEKLKNNTVPPVVVSPRGPLSAECKNGAARKTEPKLPEEWLKKEGKALLDALVAAELLNEDYTKKLRNPPTKNETMVFIADSICQILCMSRRPWQRIEAYWNINNGKQAKQNIKDGNVRDKELIVEAFKAAQGGDVLKDCYNLKIWLGKYAQPKD